MKAYESTVHEKYQMKAYKSTIYEKYKNVDKSIGRYKIGYMKVYEIQKYMIQAQYTNMKGNEHESIGKLQRR